MSKIVLCVIAVLALAACQSEKTPTSQPPQIMQTVPDHQVLGTSGNTYFIWAAKGTNAADLQIIAKSVCSANAICIVHFWNDRNLAAKSLPMTDTQLNYEVAQYNLNKNTGLDQLLTCNAGDCK